MLFRSNRLRNTPEHTASFRTRYDVSDGALAGFGMGADLEYVARRFGNDENDFELPSHTRLDLAAWYQISPRSKLELLIDNATDEAIYAEGYDPLMVIREPGRTAQLRFRYDLR